MKAGKGPAYFLSGDARVDGRIWTGAKKKHFKVAAMWFPGCRTSNSGFEAGEADRSVKHAWHGAAQPAWHDRAQCIGN